MVARRTHTKSRKGCQNCKRRRVKCDEQHPQCGPCRKHEIDCDYLLASTPSTPAPRSTGSPECSGQANGSISQSTSGSDLIFGGFNEPNWMGVSSSGTFDAAIGSPGPGFLPHSPGELQEKEDKGSGSALERWKKVLTVLQCDEDFPNCGQCQKHRIECDYMDMFKQGMSTPGTPTSTGTASTQVPSSGASTISQEDENNTASSTFASFHGMDCSESTPPSILQDEPMDDGPEILMPRPNSTSLILRRPGSVQQNVILPTFLELIPKACSGSTIEFTSADFELLHHYTSETYTTLSVGRPDIAHVFSKIVPQIGFSNPFLFHAVLAIGGEHLFRKTKSPSIRDLTAYHMSLALEQFRTELSQIPPTSSPAEPPTPSLPPLPGTSLAPTTPTTLEKAQALFITSCLVSVMAFFSCCPSPSSALGSSLPIFPVFTSSQLDATTLHDSVLTWLHTTLSVSRGTRILVESYWPTLRNSSISPIFSIHEKPASDPLPYAPLFRKLEKLFWMCREHPPDQPPSYFPTYVIDPKTASSASTKLCSTPLSKPPPPPETSPYYDLYDAISILYDHAHHGVPSRNVPWIFAWPVIVNAGYLERLRLGHWRERVVVCWYLEVLNTLDVDVWWIGTEEGKGGWVRGIGGDLEEVGDEEDAVEGSDRMVMYDGHVSSPFGQAEWNGRYWLAGYPPLLLCLRACVWSNRLAAGAGCGSVLRLPAIKRTTGAGFDGVA
ncbi:hypothetical protein BJ508DRAFT_306494 [Ascobolus immersus RN42]|uniref:Zn(2)-C6 fungal-type domain-containing protein n=1 Tax=Ascobolus immersus RN42 TaxID=1160509 RepID=A0A3N4I7K1_ASCIM|nr:hypothetical protein BJ508DRAFT_306494 [Ascobolus immersus RN42]